MRRLGVLLILRPKLLSEVVRHIFDRQPDINVLGEVTDLVELLLALKETGADVVVITPANSDQETAICSYLLREYAHLKILSLSADSNVAYVYQAGAIRKRIDPVSAKAILASLHEFIGD